MRTSNPALRESIFRIHGYDGIQGKMSMQGTAIKTFFLLSLASLTAGWIWYKFADVSIISHAKDIMTYLTLSTIGAFILSICTIFKPSWAPVTASLYALLEGVVLGSLSLILDRQYPGIVLQALPLTFGTLVAMLVIYNSGLIKVNHKFRMIMFSAMSAICLVYMLSWILSFFRINLPFIHSSGTIGVLFSLFVVGIAAFNLLLDFDFIEKGQAYGAPKYMEWYGAFSLMISLVWLYVEILRLLAKLRERDRR